jgi:phospho-N-acetylmuramoyl-pentapeptide-transferase
VLTLPFQKTYIRAGAEQNPALIYLARGAFVLLALAMVAGMSNAVNITDGMDGLAIGCTLIVALVMLILTYLTDNVKLAAYLQIPHVRGTS